MNARKLNYTAKSFVYFIITNFNSDSDLEVKLANFPTNVLRAINYLEVKKPLEAL